jgi:hypothetical protein
MNQTNGQVKRDRKAGPRVAAWRTDAVDLIEAGPELVIWHAAGGGGDAE